MRKISVNRLEPGMIIKKPVLGFLGQVLLHPGVEVKVKHIYYLKQMGITAVYVHDDLIEDIDAHDLISEQVRSESRATVARLLNNLDAAGENNKGIAFKEKEIIAAASKIVEEVLENKDIVVQLSDIRAHDGYLFAHSVNCSVLATLVAVKMNYDYNTLTLLATGALIHDIGLIAVPQMILNKPGVLSDQEYDAVKQHPQKGYQILRQSKMFSERLGEIILQHHERYQGQGYPQGLKGKEIASLARIVMVADVYDALTSEKAYRRAYPPHQAMEMLIAWGGEMFDLEVLNTLLDSLTPYPVGTHVMLDTGESGVVIAINKEFPMRPVVRLLHKKDFSPHPSPHDLDLKKVTDITITAVVDEEDTSS